MTQAHPAFEQVSTKHIESLNIHATEYRHKVTGASHFHLQADVDENVFLVGLRTVPMDSTGVAHILEHTALCGSEKYPVRDPFFMMIRRSINTFMNAFTSSDWTAYPFASENRKDYFNLLDVYLDAVFFSRLDELDFLQEGHRIEFSEPQNPESELEYKGVVFNEMKGALSAPTSRLWQAFTSAIFPTTTYHYNSGGEPKDIVNLSYEQLKSFYQTHYHPSNAMFMTFGNIPVTEIQEKIENQALSRFEKLPETISVGKENRFDQPQEATETYPVEAGETENKTHIVLGWLLGDSIDLEAQLEAHLMSNILLENSASPLRKALEQTELGVAPSPVSGLEESNREMVFVCGLEGSNPDSVVDVQNLILDTLKQEVKDGVDQERIEAVLHQLELSQREIGGDHYPYGLQLILTALPAAVHRGDALESLDIDPAIEALREKIKDPSYVPNLIQKLLLDNPHRVRLALVPDEGMAQRDVAEEKAKLADLKAKLSEEDKKKIIDLTEKLDERQNQQDDPGILPKVTLQDVPAQIHQVDPDETQPIDWGTRYQSGTNGLSYQQVVIDLPELTAQELQLLTVYANVLPELGVGEASFEDIQHRQSQFTGGVSAWTGYKAK